MLPTFFIVGAAKSGTTSLASYLGQHPEVFFSPNKEPNFFSYHDQDLQARPGPAAGPILHRLLYEGWVTERARYEALFAPALAHQQRGEASVRYLYLADAPARIAAATPAAKIVMILRDPVDRLWSHFMMMKMQYHLEPETLDRALALEPDRMRAGWDYDWHYVAVGSYYTQVQRYFDAFGRDRVGVWLYDDFTARPDAVVREVFGFLGVDSSFTPNLSSRGKVGYGVRVAWLDKLLFYPHRFYPAVRWLLRHRLGRKLDRVALRLNRGGVPRLPPPHRRKLRARFADDIARLGELLGRPLPW